MDIEIESYNRGMFAISGIMKESIVKKAAQAGNFDSRLLIKTKEHGGFSRMLPDGSFQLGVGTSVKENGHIKLPFSVQQTQKTALNIIEISQNGPALPVYNVLKQEFAIQTLSPWERKLLQDIRADFYSGKVALPTGGGFNITKIESGSQFNSTLSDIATKYPHEMQLTTHCTKLNHEFLRIIEDAPLLDKQCNLANATRLQHEANVALMNTPAKYLRIQTNYKNLINDLETFKRTQ